ncbi:MAG: right-handed parallel beta-helix repeat-containing protein [Bdellovibrionia bacterium]
MKTKLKLSHLGIVSVSLLGLQSCVPGFLSDLNSTRAISIAPPEGAASPSSPASLGTIQAIPTRSAALPSSITSGSTLSLNCGTTYYGSLNLATLSNVTIETNGNCGRAVITPAVPVSGWRVYSGSIYVADVSTEVAQVFVDSQITGIAHYPNSIKETGWLQSSNVTATSMDFTGLPNNDIVGAKATYRGRYPWEIGTRTVTAYDGQTMTLPQNTNLNLNAEDSELGKFYLEGKLWMLDTPGEWAWSGGKLYLWMPDGQAPGSRVLAAPQVNSVINVQGSTNVTIQNVRIVGGWIGVDASYSNTVGRSARGLQILNSEIAYSDWSAIYASNVENMTVDNSDVIGALHTGIYARTGSAGIVVRNSRFTNVNTVGMHKGGDGSMYINADTGATITGNTITNSGKTGIFIGQSMNSLVKDNVINGACRIHGDCGGIYLFDRGKVSLNTRVENNVVNNINGDPVRPGSTNPERYAIYLDDYSTGVTVIGNTVTQSDSGMQLHFAFNNTITGNRFEGNLQRNILFSDDGSATPVMSNNVFSNNTFVGPALSFFLAVNNPTTAATFTGNTYLNYTSSPVVNPANVPYQ